MVYMCVPWCRCVHYHGVHYHGIGVYHGVSVCTTMVYMCAWCRFHSRLATQLVAIRHLHSIPSQCLVTI